MYVVPCGNPSEQCNRWTGAGGVWGQLEIPQALCKVFTTGQDSAKGYFLCQVFNSAPFANCWGRLQGFPQWC